MAEYPRVGGEDTANRVASRMPFGTPPPRRGGPGRAAGRSHLQRNTPASAEDPYRQSTLTTVCGAPPRRRGGRTETAARLRSAGTPRFGGEDEVAHLFFALQTGAPSRRWGGQPHRVLLSDLHRNTPASAGRTRWGSARRRRGTERPCVGGEDPYIVSRPIVSIGTPPRRGGSAGPRRAYGERRSTPASAGKTNNSKASPRARTEHPRVGGEDYSKSGATGFRIGTPPRRRGRHHQPQHRHHGGGNTPASAGRTTGRRPPTPATAEHPRVGGEDAERLDHPITCLGTPPRRRGGQPGQLPHVPRDRNTPALAGRPPLSVPRRRRTAEHPRVGGEDASHSAFSVRWTGAPPRRRGRLERQGPKSGVRRSTPASAGRTAPQSSGPGGPPEHPRVGEEDHASISTDAGCAGTPPHWRGRLHVVRGVGTEQRNTPASAGKTTSRTSRTRSPAEHPRVGGEDAYEPDHDAV